MSLDGKTAVVAGAGSGIGRAIAQRRARDGAAVAVWDLNAGAAKTAQMAGDAGGKALAVTGNAADAAAIKQAADNTREAFGTVTTIVNNAGITETMPFQQLAKADWDRMMAINLKGPFLSSRKWSETCWKRDGGVSSTSRLPRSRPVHRQWRTMSPQRAD